MKKIFTFVVLLTMIFIAQANAQPSRKSWDFTKGPSDATIANIQADPTNWAITPNDDGSFKEAKDLTKMSGALKANGIVIKELYGIEFGTGGLSGNNNYIIGYNKIRVTRKGMEIKFPKLVAGQKLTIRARSANGTATDRGFTAGNEFMEYVSGPVNGVCIGGQDPNCTADEDGNYTLVWQIKEGYEGDSCAVSVKTSPQGGLDIASFMIDEGDVIEPGTIAYFYDSSYSGYTIDNDEAFGMIAGALPDFMENMEVQPIDIAGDISLITPDSLRNFDAVVLSNAISPANAFVATLKTAVAYVPMLNLSADLYEAWGFGTRKNAGTSTIDIPEAYRTYALYTPTDPDADPYIDENGQMQLFADGDGIMGFSCEEGSYFADDDVLATAAGTVAIHRHNAKRNAYMMIPLSFPTGTWGDALYEMLPKATMLVAQTKAPITKAQKPQIVEDYGNMQTTVSLTCSTPKAKIHYTTDGSEPTLESKLFTEPFVVTESNITVKAIAEADGYLTGDASEKTITLFRKNAQPEISAVKEDGKTIVTITPAADGDEILYNFRNSEDAAMSGVYTEPVTLTKHCTITAFTAAKDELLQSDPVSMDITVNNEKVRMDVVSHMNSEKADWNLDNSSPYYFIGKSGYAFYTDDIESTEVLKDQWGNDSIVNHYIPANQEAILNPGKGWEFKSYGQPGLWQSIGIDHKVFDFNGYNPYCPEDDTDNEITSNCVCFGGVSFSDLDGLKDPASAIIQSTEAFQGPFDVVTYASGLNAKVEIFVTNDTINGEWTSIGNLLANDISKKDDKNKELGNRIWRKTVLGYDGTDAMFVKFVSGGNAANIFDIYIKNQGEISNEYITGIEDVNTSKEAEGEVVRTIIYNINGVQLNHTEKGLNIIKDIYTNGTVSVRKINIK